jgi:hypothetical protein
MISSILAQCFFPPLSRHRLRHFSLGWHDADSLRSRSSCSTAACSQCITQNARPRSALVTTCQQRGRPHDNSESLRLRVLAISSTLSALCGRRAHDFTVQHHSQDCQRSHAGQNCPTASGATYASAARHIKPSALAVQDHIERLRLDSQELSLIPSED